MYEGLPGSRPLYKRRVWREVIGGESVRFDIDPATTRSCYLQRCSGAEGTNSRMPKRWECRIASSTSEVSWPTLPGILGFPALACLQEPASALTPTQQTMSGRYFLVLREREEIQSHVAWQGQARLRHSCQEGGSKRGKQGPRLAHT